MRDEQKTKAKLLQELSTLRGRVCELKQAKEALEHSEKQFKELFENTVVGVYRTAPDGRITMANPALVGMLGYSSFKELSQRNLKKEGFAPGHSRSIFKDLIEKEGKVVGLESAWLRRDGTTLFITENARVIRDESGKTLCYEGIVQDITEHKMAEEALRKSEEQHRAIFEGADDGIIYTDRKGNVIEVNPAFTVITGIPRQEVVGKNATSLARKFAKPKYVPHLLKAISQMLKGVPIELYELEVNDKIVEVSTPVLDMEAAGITGIIRDITERKRAEDALRLKNVAIESSINGIAFADLEGNLFYINESFLKLWGYSDENQVLGKPAVEFWTDPNKAAEVREVVRNRGGWTGELVAKRKDGSTFDVELSASLVKDENAKPVCMMASFVEITERKKTEDALRKSEQKLKDLFENTAVGMYRTTPYGRILMANPAIVRMLGFSSFEQLRQRNLEEEGFEPSYQRSVFKERIERQGQIVGLESRWTKQDGTTLVIIENARVVRDESGEVLYYEGTAEDITQRKKAEEALRESEEKFKGIFEHANDGIIYLDSSGKILDLNDKATQFFGGSREEVLNKHFADLGIFNSDAIPTLMSNFAAILSGEETTLTVPARNKKGQDFVFECSAALAKTDDDAERIMVVVRDITERKKAEDALWESERKYKGLAESLDEVVYRADLETFAATYVNNAVERLYDYSVEEWLSDPNLWEDSIHPDDRERVFAEFTKAQGKSKGPIIEYRIINKDKEVRWVEDSVSWERDQEGKVISMNGIMYDVTERKQAEEALRESEERLRVALSAAQMGTWRWNPETNQDTRDASLNLILGLEAVESTQPVEDFLGFVHPDDRDMTNEEIQRAIRERRTYVAEFRIIRPDGTVRWLRDQGKPLCDENDRVLCLTGAVIDITERKKAEEEIRRLSFAVEQSIDGIAIADSELKLLYVNDAFARMHGYTPQDMVGMPTAKLHNKKQLSEYWMRIDQLITEGSFEGEVGNIRIDGTAFPTYMSVTLLKNNEGKTIGSLAVVRDITESKRREKELNLYREKMARAEQLASVGTLSATLAHELAQPLTVIRLSIENALVKLEKTPSTDAVTKNIKDSLTEVSNITSIVNRFRNYARRSSKTVVSEVDLKAVAERTLQLLSHRARQARVTLRLKGMDKLPPIYSYEKDLEQLFFSLVENAVQAADGKKDCRLIISGAARDEHIELQFSDDCGGIAPESLDRIFEPFFTTRPIGEGTGLGLCIVEHVVSRARGKVRVESQAGKGTTFFVTLPINKDVQS